MKRIKNNLPILILSACILLLLITSLMWIFHIVTTQKEGHRPVVACVYQDGTLIHRIPLSQVTESYTIKVTNQLGIENIIQVNPGNIGMQSATCPDKLCVGQGFHSSPSIPITCLPADLVIVLEWDKDALADDKVDMLTY